MPSTILYHPGVLEEYLSRLVHNLKKFAQAINDTRLDNDDFIIGLREKKRVEVCWVLLYPHELAAQRVYSPYRIFNKDLPSTLQRGYNIRWIDDCSQKD